MFLLGKVYKYGSGNSKVTSLPVSFRYTDAKVSTCKHKTTSCYSEKYYFEWKLEDEYVCWCKIILYWDNEPCK